MTFSSRPSHLAAQYKSKPGIKRVVGATQNSLRGFKATYQDEVPFRQELFLCLFLVPGAFFLGRTVVEVFILLFTVALVLLMELVNSALEVLADRITQDYDFSIGRAKDIASAAVFLSILIFVLTWLAFGVQRIITWGVS